MIKMVNSASLQRVGFRTSRHGRPSAMSTDADPSGVARAALPGALSLESF